MVQLVAVIMVFAIPILGILLAGYKEWLKFKAKHEKLGTSTREVETELQSLHERVDALETEREALRERLQNLETIVTSEAWITKHEDLDALPSLNATDVEELEWPASSSEDAETDAEQIARLARRLRNR